jgi:hypothetical protein
MVRVGTVCESGVLLRLPKAASDGWQHLAALDLCRCAWHGMNAGCCAAKVTAKEVDLRQQARMRRRVPLVYPVAHLQHLRDDSGERGWLYDT